MRAIAIALDTDIIVCPPSGGVYAYPKRPGEYYLKNVTDFPLQPGPSVFCTYHGSHYLPLLAFDTTTIVLCHDGDGKIGHFWCTQVTDVNANRQDLLDAACQEMLVFDLLPRVS